MSYLYRVVERPAGTNAAWVPAVGTTYHVERAARSMRSRFVNGTKPRGNAMRGDPPMEFAIQVAPVGEWSVLSDEGAQA